MKLDMKRLVLFVASLGLISSTTALGCPNCNKSKGAPGAVQNTTARQVIAPVRIDQNQPRPAVNTFSGGFFNSVGRGNTVAQETRDTMYQRRRGLKGTSLRRRR